MIPSSLLNLSLLFKKHVFQNNGAQQHLKINVQVSRVLMGSALMTTLGVLSAPVHAMDPVPSPIPVIEKPANKTVQTADGGWHHEMTVFSRGDAKERRHVHIYTRTLEGKQLKEFKGVTTVNANANSILALIIDVPHIPKLFYNGKLAKTITGSDGKPYLYTQIAGRWPVMARDSVVSAKIHQNPVTKEIIINGYSVDGVFPEQEGHVRIKDLTSSWKILPLKNGQSRVTFIGHADPAGFIPDWLANLVVTDMPQVSLRNVHEHVKYPKYQQMKMHELKTGIENFNPLALSLPDNHKN